MRAQILVVLTLAGCVPLEPTNDPSPTIKDPPNTDLCDSMCNQLKKLGCEEGNPVYNDDLPGPKDVPNQSCGDFCRTLQKQNISVNPKCVRDITVCSQVEDYRAKDPATCQ